MSDERFVELRGLTRRFGEHTAVDNLSVTVPRGRILALLGPSGSGKTTTLRLLAGFERPDAGRVLVDGTDVTGLGPAERRFGMVFQHYALFPHLNVRENVAFGLPRDTPKADREGRVREVLALVDLAGFLDRPVDALSGGQQQRVAVARALAPSPRLLLLDEPLSNLDPTLRERTRRELKQALRKVGITTVLVTHEQEEAFALGDLVAVLREGRLEQVGTAPDLYERPASFFVATFVGRAGVLQGRMRGPDRVRVGEIEWPVAERTDLDGDATVRVVVRPEAARFIDGEGLPGIVRERRYLGARALFTVETGHGSLEVEAAARAAEVDARVRVTVQRVLVFPDAAA